MKTQEQINAQQKIITFALARGWKEYHAKGGDGEPEFFDPQDNFCLMEDLVAWYHKTKNQEAGILPCPFCGSYLLQEIQVPLQEGFSVNGRACLFCAARAPIDTWNQRIPAATEV